jgi:hypothetical protein
VRKVTLQRDGKHRGTRVCSGTSKKWGSFRLFEWISVRKKGSPEDYDAETSVGALTQSPQTGEPNEHPTLYRIRRSQETHQLLLSAVSAPRPGCSRGKLKSRGRECEFAGDPPAGSRFFGDCAKEFRLPMLPSVCFETGRFTQTQSSWTVLDDRSRKWMSGPVGKRASRIDRRLQSFSLYQTSREFLSEGKSPFSLDSYLSWMSLIVPEFIGSGGVVMICSSPFSWRRLRL